MKKKVFLIGFILLFNFVGFVWGQPNPNDVGFGANDAKPVGGGADLGMSLIWLISIALVYTIYKYRMKIIYWLVAHTS